MPKKKRFSSIQNVESSQDSTLLTVQDCHGDGVWLAVAGPALIRAGLLEADRLQPDGAPAVPGLHD